MKLVFDTDVFVDLLRTNAGPLKAVLELLESGKVEGYISSITLLELRTGEISEYQEKLLATIVDRLIIVPLDRELAQYAGRLRKLAGKNMSLSDLIIGATSKYLGASMVTRNQRHFKLIPGIKFFK